MACAALDTIGDTQLAVDDYLAGRVKAATHGTTYLAIYGVLQVLFVQQDAVRDLAEAVGVPVEVPEELQSIRDIRNATAGHPTNHKGRFSNTINRNAMATGGFELFRYSATGELRIEQIDLAKLAREQKQLIDQLLEVVAVKLENDEREHRRKWREDRIESKLVEGTSYAFEKLSEGLREGGPLGSWGLEAVTERLASFTTALEQRGLAGGFVGVEGVLSELQYPLQRLSNHFNGPGPPLSPEEGAVFAYYVRHKFKELEVMAREIDSEYESDKVRP